MRKLYAEFNIDAWKPFLLALAIIGFSFVVFYYTWGCGPSPPSTGVLEIGVVQ